MLLTYLSTHFSYRVLFVWSLLEGEVGLALAGYLSHKNYLDFWLVVLIAFCGAIISDVILYMIGKRNKRLAFRLLKHHAPTYKKLIRWTRRYGSWVIVFDRFMYGTHIPAMLTIGISHYPFKKFIILESMGVMLWSLTFTSLGYVFGEKIVSLIQMVQKNLLLGFITLVIVLIYYRNRSR